MLWCSHWPAKLTVDAWKIYVFSTFCLRSAGRKNASLFAIFLSRILVRSPLHIIFGAPRNRSLPICHPDNAKMSLTRARPHICVDGIGHVRDKWQMITADIVANLFAKNTVSQCTENAERPRAFSSVMSDCWEVETTHSPRSYRQTANL